MILGLAGKAASGKDLLLPVFVRKGFTVIDADKIGHGALEALAEPVREKFGTSDRKALGKIVFADARALGELEALVHPWIRGQIEAALDALGGRSAVVNAALLSRLAIASRLDAVIWVHAPLVTRLLRARKRDHLGWKTLLGRVWAQRKLVPQDFAGNVDIHIVENPASPELALTALETLLERLMSVFPERKP